MEFKNRFQKIVHEAKQRIREVTIEQLREQLASSNPPQLVDVREESEWSDGHARGATHLSKGVLERDIEKMFPNVETPIVMYCGGGSRSALAADVARQMGYSHVSSLIGGFKAYQEAGLPLES